MENNDDFSEIIEMRPMEKYSEMYERKEELGRGKFGVVFQVQDKESGHILAAKHIKTRKEEHKQRVKEEIGILQNLSNPHVIKFVEAFENNRELILVMEYLDGGELFERVATEDFNLTETDCCLFIRQLCRGVDYLHAKKIVHLDLKPENVICTAKDSTSLKIIDFGLAKKLTSEEKLRVMCGTPEFVAPEVVNYDVVDTSTDMWSVGVICYILLSGYSPFMGDNDSETFNNITSVEYDFDEPEFDNISQGAKDFITELLKKNKASRMDAKMCLDHPWLLEQDVGHTVIKTENLRKFLARRRWQRCGQAIRAMKRMTGLLKRTKEANLSRTSSIESLESSPTNSRNASRESSPTPASPFAERRKKFEALARAESDSKMASNLTKSAGTKTSTTKSATSTTTTATTSSADSSNSVRAPRLNLLEARLREEFGPSVDLQSRKHDEDSKNSKTEVEKHRT